MPVLQVKKARRYTPGLFVIARVLLLLCRLRVEIHTEVLQNALRAILNRGIVRLRNHRLQSLDRGLLLLLAGALVVLLVQVLLALLLVLVIFLLLVLLITIALLLLLALLLFNLAERFCPPELMVSGACTASWFPAVEAGIMTIAAGFAAIAAASALAATPRPARATLAVLTAPWMPSMAWSTVAAKQVSAPACTPAMRSASTARTSGTLPSAM